MWFIKFIDYYDTTLTEGGNIMTDLKPITTVIDYTGRAATVHNLDVHTLGGSVVTYEKLNLPPIRVATTRKLVAQLPNGVGLYHTTTGEVVGLPDEQEGVLLIVPLMVRLARPDRLDLASPGALIRNEDGQPIGCDGLDLNRSEF